MKLYWWAFCQNAIIDKDTRLPTIVGIFDGASVDAPAPELRTLIPRPFILVTRWKAGNPSNEDVVIVDMMAGKTVMARHSQLLQYDETRISTNFFRYTFLPTSHRRVNFLLRDKDGKNETRISLPITYLGKQE